MILGYALHEDESEESISFVCVCETLLLDY